MKNLLKKVLVVVVGLFVLGIIGVFSGTDNKIFVRTGMVVLDGNKVDFENPIPIAVGGQSIWNFKGFEKNKKGQKVAKLSRLDFDFSGPNVEVIETVKYITVDITSYKAGKYSFK